MGETNWKAKSFIGTLKIILKTDLLQYTYGKLMFPLKLQERHEEALGLSARFIYHISTLFGIWCGVPWAPRRQARMIYYFTWTGPRRLASSFHIQKLRNIPSCSSSPATTLFGGWYFQDKYTCALQVEGGGGKRHGELLHYSCSPLRN